MSDSTIQSLCLDALDGLSILAYGADDESKRWERGLILWLDAALEYHCLLLRSDGKPRMWDSVEGWSI